MSSSREGGSRRHYPSGSGSGSGVGSERSPPTPEVEISTLSRTVPCYPIARGSSGPMLNPTWGQFYRPELTQHVQMNHREYLEKQINRLADDSHALRLQCRKVSIDLKMTRSLVRLAEIQATLQEQRILFLRQQIHELESMGSCTSNSYHSHGDT